MAGFGWRALGFSRFGRVGGDQWLRWLFCCRGLGFFGFLWVWSGWVEIGGQGGRFCWRRLGFSRFDRGGDRWSFLYCLIDRDSDWASTRWIQCCWWWVDGGFGFVDGGFGFVDDGFGVVNGRLFVVFWIGMLFNEVLGWRVDDFSRLVFWCWFGFDEFS